MIALTVLGSLQGVCDGGMILTSSDEEEGLTRWTPFPVVFLAPPADSGALA